MQVDPIKPTLKHLELCVLKLKVDGPPSNFAFKFNLHHYIEGQRLYLHGGKGHYGAVPLAASGDMDLNGGKNGRDKNGERVERAAAVVPGERSGEYRISAQVAAVDGRGQTLLHLSAQPEPHLPLKLHETPKVFHKMCLR